MVDAGSSDGAAEEGADEEEVAEEGVLADELGIEGPSLVRLIDLLQAYARLRTRDEFRPYAYDRRDIWTLEDALDRMRRLIGHAGGWTDLARFLPAGFTVEASRGHVRDLREEFAEYLHDVLAMRKAAE